MVGSCFVGAGRGGFEKEGRKRGWRQTLCGKERTLVKINGELRDVTGKTVSECLVADGYDVKRVAVERNGQIVPKAQYDGIVLEDDDVVEIVSFVGGG